MTNRTRAATARVQTHVHAVGKEIAKRLAWLLLIVAALGACATPSDEAAFMADSQVPWGVDALRGTIAKAAWRTKPSWYLVASEDRMIPPAAQRFMATRAGATMFEEKGSHSIYVSQPRAVAAIIAKAATGVKVTPAGSEEAEQAGRPDSGRGKELDADRHAGA